MREFPVVAELSKDKYEGIGAVVFAHALLEWHLTRVLYKLLKIDHPEGRLAVRVPNIPDRLKLIRKLLDLRNIKITIDTKKLLLDVEDYSGRRDALAHGIWVLHETGEVMLRLTKGEYPTPEGKVIKREHVPQGVLVDPTYYGQLAANILTICKAIYQIEQEVDAALASSPQKSS